MIKEVTQTHLGSIWYYLNPSELPYSTNNKQNEGFFFWVRNSEGALLSSNVMLTIKNVVKFRHSEKATKIWNYPPLDLTFSK